MPHTTITLSNMSFVLPNCPIMTLNLVHTFLWAVFRVQAQKKNITQNYVMRTWRHKNEVMINSKVERLDFNDRKTKCYANIIYDVKKGKYEFDNWIWYCTKDTNLDCLIVYLPDLFVHGIRHSSHVHLIVWR